MHSKPALLNISHYLYNLIWIALGAFLAAVAIELVLKPNNLIDGGVVGISMICAHLTKDRWGDVVLSALLVLLNLPFLIVAFRQIGRLFVAQMFAGVVLFAAFVYLLGVWECPKFYGDALEVIAVGGFCLGVGIGIIIRRGACLDGTEILAILIQKTMGFTVGQVILVINVVVFGLAGFAFGDWHIPVKSMMTYVIASKLMDLIIVGLQETKSVFVIAARPKEVAQALVHELGLGLTFFYGRGGFSGEQREILYLIVERLQLAELKEIIHREDPTAFVAIENLQEVINGRIRGVSFPTLLKRGKESKTHH